MLECRIAAEQYIVYRLDWRQSQCFADFVAACHGSDISASCPHVNARKKQNIEYIQNVKTVMMRSSGTPGGTPET
jgi:hypothetical protein